MMLDITPGRYLDPRSGENANSILICRDCDTVHRAISLRRGDTAICIRCGAVIARFMAVDADTGLALVLAAAICFSIANLCPILSIDVAGVETSANVWLAVRSLQQGWIRIAGGALAFTNILVPALQIALLLWVLVFARAHRRAPAFETILALLHRLRPWSMTEVFLLGALVAVVKLTKWVPIVTGPGLWATAILTALLACLGRCDPASWWALAPKTRT